jgi:hypothetical protein
MFPCDDGCDVVNGSVNVHACVVGSVFVCMRINFILFLFKPRLKSSQHMRPESTSACGLQIQVCAALSY